MKLRSTAAIVLGISKSQRMVNSLSIKSNLQKLFNDWDCNIEEEFKYLVKLIKVETL